MKFYAIPMTVYVEAFDEEKAAAVGEMNAFACTQALRKVHSGFNIDETTIMTCTGKPVEIRKQDFPKESYKKEPIIKAFGEDSGIHQMNNIVNRIHP